MRRIALSFVLFGALVVAPASWIAFDGYRALGVEEREALADRARAADKAAESFATACEAAIAEAIEQEEGRSIAESRAAPSPWASGYFEASLDDIESAPAPISAALADLLLRAEERWLGRSRQAAQTMLDQGQQSAGQPQKQQQEVVRSPFDEIRPLPLPEAPARVDARQTDGKEPQGKGEPVDRTFYYSYRMLWAPRARYEIRLVRSGSDRVSAQGFLFDVDRLLQEFARPRITALEAAGFDVRLPATCGNASIEVDGTTVSSLAVHPADLDTIAERAAERMNRFLGAAALQGLVVLAGLAALGWLVRRQLEFARRRAEFAAAVSHEMRTPLAAIRMHVELLGSAGGKDPGAARESLSFIRSEAARLTRLVENVLARARIEKRAKEYRFETGDLGEVVREVQDAYQELAAAAGARIDFRIEPGLPAVRFDRDAVRQILVNLLDNAIKFSPNAEALALTKQVELSVSARDGRVALEVADRGIGIGTGDPARLFEPFRRGKDPRARELPGTGLGLSIVAEYAHAHGALVRASNREGGGAIFAVEFPGSG